MKDRQTASGVVFLIIAACVPQVIIYNTLPVIFLNDSVWYLDLTRYFAAGGFFPDYYASSKPVHCMIIYPLGYSLFLDFCRLWGPTLFWGKSIVLFQHLLSLGSVLLLFLIGKRIGRGAEGFCAALAYAFYFPRLLYAQAIMAETLCIFLLLLSLYFFFSILNGRGGKPTGIALGILTALSILTKPLAFISAGIFFLYFLIFPAGRRVLGGFVLSLGIVIFANFFYNWYFYGQPIMASSGIHLANRVLDYDRLIDKKNPETREIISQCSKSGLVFRFPGKWWDYMRALRSHGLSAQEADHLLMKAAIAGIWSNPFTYIKRTFLVFGKDIFEKDRWIDRRLILSKEDYFQYLHDWSTYEGGMLPPAEYESRRKMLKTIAVDYPQGPCHALGVGWINFFDNKVLKWKRYMGGLFLIFSIYGLIAKDRILFFVSTFIIVNLLFVALNEAPYPRYFETFVPIVLLYVFLSFSTFTQRICKSVNIIKYVH